MRHVLRLATDDEVVAGVDDERVAFAFDRRLAVALFGVLWIGDERSVRIEEGRRERRAHLPPDQLRNNCVHVLDREKGHPGVALLMSYIVSVVRKH